MTDGKAPDSDLSQDERPGVVLVTGPSGAGRTTAIRVLEDIGFEVIDNLPLSLVPRLFSGPPLERPLALGIDVRNRDFSTSAVLDLVAAVQRGGQTRGELLFLDCRPDVLVQRYSETRRRHPLAPTGTPSHGIAREIELLHPVRLRADVMIDTSDLSPHDLRAQIVDWYTAGEGTKLAVSVQSFSYKRGIPEGLDLVFDVRFLRNPHWEPSLRPLTGQDPDVAAYVAADPRFEEFTKRTTGLVEFLLPAYLDEGKTHLSIGFGCTGGQHRSVALTEFLTKALAEQGWQVSIRHRELERKAAASPVAKGG